MRQRVVKRESFECGAHLGAFEHHAGIKVREPHAAARLADEEAVAMRTPTLSPFYFLIAGAAALATSNTPAAAASIAIPTSPVV